MAERATTTRDLSRRLRREQTDVERKLWSRLRSRNLGGAKFRRQHPIGPYIADFCYPERGLVIELDGGHHAQQAESDRHRQAFLETNGYRVLRFWNNEMMGNLDGVLERIAEATSNPHPSPLPERERG